MLSRLSIRDIVLIDRLDIDFRSGLSVLTGETGAGKSILLDALALSLGARGDGALVRTGVEQGHVIAVFEPDPGHSVFALLRSHEIEEEGTVILRRVQRSDGRTKAFVNDQPVSVSLLRDIGRELVEIHGQHDDRALIDIAMHRQLLDSFGGLEARLSLVETAWQALQKTRKELDVLTARVEAGEREADYLRSSVEELTILAPEPGEETKLAEKRAQMMQAEKIAGDINDAHEELAGDGSSIPSLSSLLRRLERKAGNEPGMLSSAIEALANGVNQLHLAQEELQKLVHELEFDPAALERSEERLFALRAASRKFSVSVEDLPDLAVKMADDLAELDSGADRLGKLKQRVETLEAEYLRLAEALSQDRREAALRLCEQVASELPSLKLDQAEFIVHFDESGSQPGPHGIDDLEFWVRTNPGSRPGPLLKVASGGELSRFLLALKVSLADRGSAPTLVFDEIDSGAGGAVADAIGRRLVRLSEQVQVLSVTHAPQVAARAVGHFLISKQAVGNKGDGERVATEVEVVDGNSRREEIARMLAGATVTEEARAAAEKLINQPAA